MGVSDKSMAVANNFVKFIKTGDKSLIADYSLEELKHAKYEYSRDSHRDFYIAIVDRINELEEKAKHLRSKKEKWSDRAIGFVIGIISAILIALLINMLGLG